jgi:hypothetical protein
MMAVDDAQAGSRAAVPGTGADGACEREAAPREAGPSGSLGHAPVFKAEWEEDSGEGEDENEDEGEKENEDEGEKENEDEDEDEDEYANEPPASLLVEAPRESI